MNEQPKCELCGEPMPEGEEMFKYHGYSGPCPKPYGSGQVAPQGDQNEAKVVTPQGTTEERFREKFGSPLGLGDKVQLKEGSDTMLLSHADLLSFIQSETPLSYQRGQDDLRERMRCVLQSHFKLRPLDKHYGATTDNKRKAKNTVLKEIASELEIDLEIDSLLKAKESNQK